MSVTVHVQRLAARLKRENVFVFFSFSSLLLQASVMVSALFALHFVPPELMGIWQTLTLIYTYGDVLNLGITRGLSRELPFSLGRGERERAWGLAATAQFYVLLIGGLGGALFIGVALVARTLTPEWTLALLGMGMYWSASIYRSYLGVTFRAESEFQQLTIVQFIEAGLNLISLVLVVVGGFTGMVARFALLGLTIVVLLHRIRPVRVRPQFKRQNFGMLLATGIPLYISGYLYSASLAFDQTIVLQRGSVELVGLYTPVAAITAIMLAIRASITSYVYPRVVFQLGQRRKPQVVRRGVLQVTVVTAAVSIPVVVGGLIALPWALPRLFPQYVAALSAMQLALVGGLCLALDATALGLFALKAWRYVAVYTVCALVLRWSVPWVLTQNGHVLTGVALGGGIAHVLVFIIGVGMVWAATQGSTLSSGAQGGMGAVTSSTVPMESISKLEELL